MTKSLIDNVSDTALWVASYRAKETRRTDALFRDPFAERLCGDRGVEIAKSMGGSARYTEWSVIVRTCIIDSYLQSLIKQGVDTVINLGAGLDTRPYRMKLPKSLRWIEVDYPHMIKYKQEILANEEPNCQLLRMGQDLSDVSSRQELFKILGAKTKKAVVITEGVAPYLDNEQVASLAKDLRSHGSFQYWIVDYFSSDVIKHLRGSRYRKKMQNAPFKFNPEDWFLFFKNLGWKAKETRYLVEESEKLGRPIPIPWWGRLLAQVFSSGRSQAYRKFTAYVILTPE